jgi:hypothetical protein
MNKDRKIVSMLGWRWLEERRRYRNHMQRVREGKVEPSASLSTAYMATMVTAKNSFEAARRILYDIPEW